MNNARPCCGPIARVIVARTAPDRIDVKIVWVSGHCSQGVVIPPILRQHEVTGHDAMVVRIHQLWRDGYRDTQIADTLSREGFRSARRAQVSAATVVKIRKHHRGSVGTSSIASPTRLTMWTIRGLAGQLGVSAPGWTIGFERLSESTRCDTSTALWQLSHPR